MIVLQGPVPYGFWLCCLKNLLKVSIKTITTPLFVPVCCSGALALELCAPSCAGRASRAPLSLRNSPGLPEVKDRGNLCEHTESGAMPGWNGLARCHWWHSCIAGAVWLGRPSTPAQDSWQWIAGQHWSNIPTYGNSSLVHPLCGSMDGVCRYIFTVVLHWSALTKSPGFKAPAVPHWPVTGWQWGKPETRLLFLMLQKQVSESGNEIWFSCQNLAIKMWLKHVSYVRPNFLKPFLWEKIEISRVDHAGYERLETSLFTSKLRAK